MGSSLIFGIVVVTYSLAYQYLWETHALNLMPGIWYAGIAVLALVVWLMSVGSKRKPGDFNTQFHKRNRTALIAWAATFLGLATFSYLFSDQAPQQLRALKTVIICVGMLLAFLLALNGQREVRVARLALTVVVLVSVANNFADILGLHAFSQVPGRAAGFYVNPNIAGFYLVTGMILTASLVPARWRLAYCFLVGVGVAITFSRSSVIMWLVGLYGLAHLDLFRLSRRKLMVMWSGIVSLLLVVQFGGNVVETFGLADYLSEDARLRLHFDFKKDESVRGRLEVAERSLELINQAKWVGHGLGAHSLLKTNVEPHNMFLLMGVELGILGVGLYSALLVVFWRMGAGIPRVFVAAFVVASLFSHNVLDYAAIWLAFAVVSGIAASRQASLGDSPQHPTLGRRDVHIEVVDALTATTPAVGWDGAPLPRPGRRR